MLLVPAAGGLAVDADADAAADAGLTLLAPVIGANLDGAAVADDDGLAATEVGADPGAPLFCIALISAWALAFAAATCAWMLLSPPFCDVVAGLTAAGAEGGTPARRMAGLASERGFLGGVPPWDSYDVEVSSSSLPNTLRIGRLGGILTRVLPTPGNKS